MKLQRLDAARGFAASYVVASHTIPHDLAIGSVEIGYAFRFGQEAVILFFLLSGFVIHYSYRLHNGKSAARYYFDRATRIFIPLIPVFLLSYVVASIVAGKLINADIPALLGNVSMLQDVAVLKPGTIVSPYMGNDPLWSLSYEWWFYMAYFPLLAMGGSWQLKSRLVIIAAVTAAIIYIWIPTFPVRIAMYMLIWWSGALLAHCYLDKQRVGPEDVAWVLWPLCIVILILVVNIMDLRATGLSLNLGLYPVLEARHFISALVIVTVAVAWQSLRWVGFKLLILPFRFVAPFSYGLYIVHTPILLLDRRFEHTPVVLRVLVLGLVLVIVANLLERLLYPVVKTALRHHIFAPDLVAAKQLVQ